MKIIKIAHLYYDLMNLYGENGNVRVLKKHLENQALKVEVYFLTVDDKIDFEKYDFFYIGCGSNENFLITLYDIKKYQNDIKKALENNKFFLVTGSSLNLFGKHFNKQNNLEDSLNILNFESKQIDFRIVGEQIFQNPLLNNPLIGFQNRDYIIHNHNEKPLFKILTGTGSKPKSLEEGIYKNNFFGTYLLGPILARNPHFTEYLVQKILEEKNIPYKHYEDQYETKAYQEYLKNVNN